MDKSIIAMLESALNKKNRIIIFDVEECESIFLEIVKSVDPTCTEIWHSMQIESENDSVKYLRPEYLKEILNIYRLYDFSDKVTIISENSQYGSLFNYVKNGILTVEEMAEAILFKCA